MGRGSRKGKRNRKDPTPAVQPQPQPRTGNYQPRSSGTPTIGQVQAGSFRGITPTVSWKFFVGDYPDKKVAGRRHKQWLHIMKKLSAMERTTWGTIVDDWPHTHSVNYSKLNNKACRELEAVGAGEYQDNLFQVGFEGTGRLQGIRSNTTFFVVWLDWNHSVYPKK